MASIVRSLPTATRSYSTASHHPPVTHIITSINSLLQTLPTTSPPNPHPLNQFSPYLTPTLVLQILKSQTNPQTALYFFNWSSNPNPNPNNYSHTPSSYSAILSLLLSHGLYTTSISLLQSTNNLSDFTISKLIKSYGDRGDIRGAIHWLNHAKSIESNRCLYSYNAILTVLVRANRVDLAKVIFNQILKERVVKPDVSTFTLMIRGFCKLGLVKDAQKVFDEMSCTPNLITYNTILAGFCRKGDMKSAREIVHRMRFSSSLPDTVTFSTLIDGYCKQSELEEALRWFDEMVERKCLPNVLTYNSLINGLCLNGRVEDGKRMMMKMRFDGLKDNVVTHTSLLKGYCISGRCDDTAKHLKEMVSVGPEPDEKAYAVVINEFCKMKRPNEAVELLDEMKRRAIKPSVASFNVLFRVLSSLGELDRAICILKEMPQRGCSPNFLSYSVIICSLCRVRGRMQDVEDLVVYMSRKGHCPDATIYSCMVTGYCEEGDVPMAVHMFYEMMEKGFMINLESFSGFVREMCGKGKASEVKRLYEQMCRRCPICNVDAYKTILYEHLCNLWNDLPEHFDTYFEIGEKNTEKLGK